MKLCYHCGSELPFERATRSALCPSCGKEVKVCMNCRFYKKGAHWDCAETISEPVSEKDRANFCDFFMFAEEPRKHADSGSQGSTASNRSARSQFNKLFGDE